MDIAGEGPHEPLPDLGPMEYRAVLGKTTSGAFETRDEARAWITTRRAETNDHDSDSRVIESIAT